MKHRFYGDKKDYIKYGLLNVLSSRYSAIGINWYLTPDHHGNQNHGNDTQYLDDEKWSHYCRLSRDLTPFPQIEMTPFLLSLLEFIF